MNTDLQATYNRIAQDWVADHNMDDWWIEGADYFISAMKGNKSVLDAGCGAGLKSKYLSERGCSVVGIDFSEGQLRLARSAAPDARFRLLALEELDKMRESFDGIFAQASLLHIPKKEIPGIIAKMSDRLHQFGLLYIAVKEITPQQAEEEVKKENKYGYDFERFFSYYTMPKLESYLKRAGFEVIWKTHKSSGPTIWLQIIGRKC